MAKQSIEDELLEALDKQTEPYAAWRADKKAIQKGTAAVRAEADYAAETKGHKLTDKVEAYAKGLYTAMDRAGNQDPKMLAHQLRVDLGSEHYGELREALKIGDVDTAGKLTRDALENKVGAAQLESIIEKITSLPPDSRIEFGKESVKKVGGTDYFLAAERPSVLADALRKQKAIAGNYKN